MFLEQSHVPGFYLILGWSMEYVRPTAVPTLHDVNSTMPHEMVLLQQPISCRIGYHRLD
jgi:hypothetical protein